MIKGNEAAIEELLKGICDIDFKMFKEQREKLSFLSCYDSSLPEEFKEAIEGILNLLDFISDWMEDHPEVIFDTKL